MLERIMVVHTENADLAYRGQIAKVTAALIGIGTLLSLGNFLLTSGLTSPILVIHFGLLVVVCATIALTHFGYVRSSGLFMTGVIFAAITAAAAPNLGGRDIVATTYILPVLMAGLLISGSAVLLFGGLSLLAIGYLTSINPATDWSTRTTSSLLIIFLSTGLTWLIIRTLERALNRARQQTAAALQSQQVLATQQAALQAANEELSTANAQMTSLLDLVRDLETPVIPLLEGVLVMPLVGHVDTRRANQLTEAVLAAVHVQRARIVIVDITGVSVVDTAVAQRLGRLAQSVQLLGAQVVLTGIRAEVAQTIVAQGLDFSNIKTAGRLQDGVAAVLSRELRGQETNGNHHARQPLN